MATVLIQGINCVYRDIITSTITEEGELVDGEDILYSELPQSEQYFRRTEHPFLDDDQLVEIATASYDERKSKYNKIQLEWVEREEKRMTYGNGVYAMIDDNLTYIPASYWGYINHWTLENGEQPEYRESDRIFFLFFEYICFETEVLGIARGKSRRIGATSIGFYLMWWICGRMEEKRGGSISFNDDAAGRNFNTMFMRGFKGMLPCFVRDFDSTAEKFVRFVKPVEKAKKGVIKKREGLNSYCDYLSNSLNAYDSQRLSFLLADETAKYEKMDINTYWSKVTPTLKTGRKKIGFAYMPTTVNPKNKGGENYEKFWRESNQNEKNLNTNELFGLNTRHKVIRYFVPATEGYAGCIDKFGRSVINDPIEPIMGNDGEWITEGSLSIIMKERALKEGEQLMEHRRDFPLTEHDMFSFATGVCEFVEENIIKQQKWLEENKSKYFLRQIRLYRDLTEWTDIMGKKKSKELIKFMDDPKGDWLLLEKPDKENNYKHLSTFIDPLSTLQYCIGVDTFGQGFAKNGSKGTICVFKKSCIVDGKETGLMPVAFYVGRPRLVQHFYDEVLKACLWYGCKVNFEIDRGDQYYGYFSERSAGRLLEWTPFLDPTKNHPLLKPGTESANPFELASQLEVAKMYIDGTLVGGYNGNVHRVYFPDLLQQLLEYKHDERTPYDMVIALMMALLVALKQSRAPMRQRELNILPTYDLKIA